MGPTTKLLRTQSDERLVALAQAGHEAAFEAIVERYRKPLLRAGRRVLSESRAEDAVQQAFLAAWRALRRGDEVRELRPWLYRIMQNTALNALRVRGYDHSELEESLRVAEAPQDEIERRDVVRRTLAGLASLPERQREALLRTAVEGRSQAEVAAAMGLTDGAVRQLVHRARHSLRTAATALVPFPAMAWVASASTRGPIPERVAELVAGAGGAGATAAALAKAGTVAVVAGTAVGGGVALKQQERPAPAKAAEVRSDDRDRMDASGPATVSDAAALDEEDARPARRTASGGSKPDEGERRRGGDEERGGRTEDRRSTSRRGSSGPGPSGSGDDDDESHSGRDDDEHEDDGVDDDRSGSDDEADEVDEPDEIDEIDEIDEPDEPDDSSDSGSDDAVESSSDSSGSGSETPELDD